MKRSPVDSRYTRDFSSIMDGAVIHHMRRALRRERIFRDRQNPLDIYTDDQMFERFRFRRGSILFLLGLISDSIEFSSMRNHCLPPLLQIFITLRFLACGSFLVVVGDTVPVVSKATVCRCVRRVCLALSTLTARFIRMQRTDQEKATVKQNFFAVAGAYHLLLLSRFYSLDISKISGTLYFRRCKYNQTQTWSQI